MRHAETYTDRALQPPIAAADIHSDWFDELERLGESFRFRLGRFCEGMTEPQWFVLPHQHFDGIGGLAYVLRTTLDTELELPELAPQDRPSSWARMMAALRMLLRPPTRPLAWLSLDAASEPFAQPAFAWTLFSAAETSALRRAARERGVSLNALLLWGLSEVCMPHLSSGRGRAAWIVPVNMRGAVPSKRDTENLASILDVSFPLPATPSAVDEALRTERGRLGHWGTWQLLHLVGLLDKRSRAAVIRHEARICKHGSFSNLGRLGPLEPVDDTVPEWWMAFNPVIRSRPVGMACLSWRGRMAATLQLHPVLSPSQHEPQRWLAAWREAVLPADLSRRSAVSSAPRGQGAAP
jgi:hypothetical protein